jgi:hypothetical protein
MIMLVKLCWFGILLYGFAQGGGLRLTFRETLEQEGTRCADVKTLPADTVISMLLQMVGQRDSYPYLSRPQPPAPDALDHPTTSGCKPQPTRTF